jgi:uncharacterized repeat protein (TIGR03803 family)
MNRMHRQSWISSLRPQIASAALAFTVALLIAVVAMQSAQAQTFTLLHTFNYTDGAEPYNNSLLQDRAGNFYSATDYGDLGACFFGCGVVFKRSTSGKETVLYRFTGGKDGGMPYGLAVRDAVGNYYGATLAGGSFAGACNGYGCGTVFKVDKHGKETVLYRFTGKADGEGPYGGLIQDAKGNFYGTTSFGGASGAGTIFKLDKTGKLTVLHTLSATKDGAFPLAGLVRDRKGNFYGTTSGGGTSGDGTAFRLDATGKFAVLHTFTGADGEYPGYGPLLLDSAGNLYGTTRNGGSGSCQEGCGVVFKVDKTGSEMVLYSFTGAADGASPYSSLVQDTTGNLYGTTESGGTGCGGFGCGVIFKLDTTGKETVLYSFSAGNDGASPLAGLYRDAKGILYGTTYAGGAHGVGTVFKLTP